MKEDDYRQHQLTGTSKYAVAPPFRVRYFSLIIPFIIRRAIFASVKKIRRPVDVLFEPLPFRLISIINKFPSPLILSSLSITFPFPQFVSVEQKRYNDR